MFGLGLRELIIILVVLILLFGAKKIPELARGIADGVKQLRGAFKEDDKDNNKDENKIEDTK